MNKKIHQPRGRPTDSTQQLERLVRRLAQKIPGYPYELAQPLMWAKWRQRFDGIGERELAALPGLLRRQIVNLERPAASP
jgi:hypothetical protein